MERRYFINVRFFNESIDKFAYGIIDADLTKHGLSEIAKAFAGPLNETSKDINIDVRAFNPID